MFESFIGVNFWTALFVLLNTLALFAVAKKYLFVPVRALMDSRRQEVDGMYAAADGARNEALAMQAEYRRKLSAAQADSERMVREAVDRGRSREEEILRRAKEEADAIRAKAAADTAREKKKAIREARDEISVIALAIAGKVVGRELTADHQSALVDAFIDGLGDQT